MKIEISNTKKSKGLILKKNYPAVKLTVTFSEAELRTIKENKLENLKFMERNWGADCLKEVAGRPGSVLSVRALLEGDDIHALLHESDSHQYIENLRNALTELKARLAYYNSGTAADESFAL